ncbi:MAG: indolepyruvate oxidoreductase subunit beta family protein [Paracoccaceae bacterium]
MTLFTPDSPDPKLGQIIKLAVMAVGGQGGGVLAGWIEDLARVNGYHCQATSVAGVAQRTGATIYYIEMALNVGSTPIFSLAPAAGDVDILIAAEMMEAGRAIMRGFVTPDRTTLIASTHRALAVSEKSVPGDGIANSAEVIAAAEIAAQRLVLADLEMAATEAGSVISASLFGALAGSNALPFKREAFEAAIRASGKGVAPSLRAFEAGYDAARGAAAKPVKMAALTVNAVTGPTRMLADWHALEARVAALPATVAEMAGPGLRKVVDFQDVSYGSEYLALLETVLAKDSGANGFSLSREAAKYIANAMAYDDIIRVADLKTRAARAAKIRTEMGATHANLLQLTEFLHPRAEEIAGMLPAKLGAHVEASGKWMARLDRWFNRGRRLRSDSLRDYLLLHTLGGLRGYRRRTLRHHQEIAHLNNWLSVALGYLPSKYDLSVEVLRCRRLVKGYSDTHSRGLSKFDRVMEGITLVVDRDDAADWARRLREAALLDENGHALDGALQTIRSFT